MAAADEEALLVGGTLSADGTALGTVVGVALEFVGVLEDIVAEEFGGEVWDQVYLREEWVCTAILANWDADALEAYFPNVANGLIDYPGSHTYGNLQSDKSAKLSISPTNSWHPAFTLSNALPQLARTAISFNSQDPLFLEMTWLGVRNSSNDVAQLSAAAPSALTDIWDSLVLWLDASDRASITEDANGVSSWRNKAGLGPSALGQSTDSSKPNVAAANVNGLDAILFNDSNSEFLSATSAVILGAPFSVFVVAKPDTTTPTTMSPFAMKDYDNETTYYDVSVNAGGVVRWTACVSNSSSYATATSNVTANVAYLLTGREIGSSSRSVEVDGANTGTNSDSREPSMTNMLWMVGARVAQFFSGHICEIIVADESTTALTAAQIAAIETYLERWGLTIP